MAREGGARVAPKQLLRDTNVPLANPSDQRQLDMVAYGITRQGIALCCDATMVSPLDRQGRPIPRAAARDGATLLRAFGDGSPVHQGSTDLKLYFAYVAEAIREPGLLSLAHGEGPLATYLPQTPSQHVNFLSA